MDPVLRAAMMTSFLYYYLKKEITKKKMDQLEEFRFSTTFYSSVVEISIS